MGAHHTKHNDISSKENSYFHLEINDISINREKIENLLQFKEDESPKLFRPRAKTISQAYPSLAFWRMRHKSTISSDFHLKQKHYNGDQDYMNYLPYTCEKLLPTVFYWDPKKDIDESEISSNTESDSKSGDNASDKHENYSEHELEGKSPRFIMDISPKLKLPQAFKFPHTLRKRVLHHSLSEHKPKSVLLIGSWDDWNSKYSLVYSDDQYSTIINIPEGQHEYHFLVDNVKTVNEEMPTVKVYDGSRNNVIEVRKSDFQVFDALAEDMLCTHKSGRESADSSSGSNQIVTDQFLNYLDDTGYTKDIPSPFFISLWDKKNENSSNPSNFSSSGPPFLPPQLLQIILNHDVPYNFEPCLLPQPNHVMVNHLYALSIKDNVMVLSTTHRHNKKYITTLIYKPIGSY